MFSSNRVLGGCQQLQLSSAASARKSWQFTWTMAQLPLQMHARSLDTSTLAPTIAATQGKLKEIMLKVTNFQNEEKGEVALSGDIFDVPIRKDIIHRVVRWQLAKRRQGRHSTKTVSEVSGTGKKPHPQKGSGRARHGTLRGPQFRHGATMHGPKPRSHAIGLQKKVRRLGLKIALSARAAENKLLLFDSVQPLSHKTREMVKFISGIGTCKKILFVDGTEKVNKPLQLATQNLHYANVLPAKGLNVYSVLLHDTLVMTVDAVRYVEGRLHTPISR
ncbi:hypothetical protein O6H91_06G137700 [Diphasiastrum complanatum]|nr:hypothetical protein O6H91_06G137700 [Diphasiastrum complanatum]